MERAPARAARGRARRPECEGAGISLVSLSFVNSRLLFPFLLSSALPELVKCLLMCIVHESRVTNFKVVVLEDGYELLQILDRACQRDDGGQL